GGGRLHHLGKEGSFMAERAAAIVAPPQTFTADDSAPTAARQAELRAAYEANVAAGQPPYAGVAIRTRGELAWLMAERGWSGEHDAYSVKYVLAPRGQSSIPSDLRTANLSHTTLRELFLPRPDLSRPTLVFADLRGAHLADAQLTHADMGRVDLTGAELNYADLAQAHLREAKLIGANLQYATLPGARLHRADLRAAILHGARLDVSTILSEATLDANTWLGDVIWDNAPLARLNWSQAPRLGDETAIAQAPDRHAKLVAYQTAVRAHRQLALALLE